MSKKERVKQMFDNIGGKIKSVAKSIAWTGIIAFVGYGIALLFLGAVIDGVLFAVIGALASWVGSFALYGFGELIENSTSINHNLEKLIDMNNEKKYRDAESKGTEPAKSDTLHVNQPSYAPISEAEKKERLAKGGWECTCGRVNQFFVSTCVCGKNKREVEA